MANTEIQSQDIDHATHTTTINPDAVPAPIKEIAVDGSVIWHYAGTEPQSDPEYKRGGICYSSIYPDYEQHAIAYTEGGKYYDKDGTELDSEGYVLDINGQRVSSGTSYSHPGSKQIVIRMACRVEVTMYGAGGGSAAAAWSNSSGSYGGACAAAGGAGGFIHGYLDLQKDDIVTFVVGDRGVPFTKTMRSMNGKFNITGGAGGATYIQVQRKWTEMVWESTGKKTVFGLRGRYVPVERVMAEPVMKITGGTGGSISLVMSSSGNIQTDRVANGGVGGLCYVVSGIASNKSILSQGKPGALDLKFDPSPAAKTSFTCNADGVKPEYGWSAGAKAWKKVLNGAVSLGAEATDTSSCGAIHAVFTSLATDNLNKKKNSAWSKKLRLNY